MSTEEIDLSSIEMSLLNLEDAYRKFKSAYFLYVEKPTGLDDKKVESVKINYEEVTQRLNSCWEKFIDLELLHRETENI